MAMVKMYWRIKLCLFLQTTNINIQHYIIYAFKINARAFIFLERNLNEQMEKRSNLFNDFFSTTALSITHE